MTDEQCIEIHGELAMAREKGLVRFVGFSAHHFFDKAQKRLLSARNPQ
jgi:hypothetical protein